MQGELTWRFSSSWMYIAYTFILLFFTPLLMSDKKGRMIWERLVYICMLLVLCIYFVLISSFYAYPFYWFIYWYQELLLVYWYQELILHIHLYSFDIILVFGIAYFQLVSKTYIEYLFEIDVKSLFCIYLVPRANIASI